MKTLFLIPVFVLMLFFKSGAQVTISNAEAFSIGDSVLLQECSYIDPGPAGANQVWNFSGIPISPTVTTEHIVSPSEIPTASLFPSCTYVESYSNGQNVFINKNSGNHFLLGYSDPSILVKYPVAMNFFQSPFVYGNSYTTYYTTSYSSQSYNFSGSGTLTANVDGYGTLILPNGNYNNVLRVKIKQIQKDTLLQFMSVSQTTTTSHFFFDNLHSSSLIRFDSIYSSTYNHKSARYLVNSPTTGINQHPAQAYSTRVYPNPSAGNFTVSSTHVISQVELINAYGQSVEFSLHKSLAENEIRITHPAMGVYYLKLWIDNHVIVKKLILDSR